MSGGAAVRASRGPVAVGLACLLASLVFLPAAPYWLDAPEFLAAGDALAQPHPPGHPVMVLLLKVFLLLPVGDVPFRGNLFSAVLGAAAAGLACVVATRLALALPRVTPRTARLAGVSAGLAYGLCASAVIQAMSVEVYTLHAVLVLGALALALHRPDDARATGGVAILAALGLGNHHLLVFLVAPALLVMLGRRLATRAAIPAVAAGLLATAGAYAFLVARSLAGAWPAWADTSGLGGLFWVASARVFAASVGGFEGGTGEGLATNAIRAVLLLARDLSLPGLAAAAVGAYLLARRGVRERGATGRAALAILLFVAGDLASKGMMGILDPDNPDDHGYFLPAVAGVAALAAALGGRMLAAAGSASGRGARVPALLAGVAILAGVPAAAIVSGAPVAEERAGEPGTTAIDRAWWEALPPGAVVLVSHYPVYFLAQYGARVEGTRPDVTLVQESWYHKAQGGAFYARRVAADDPDLAPLAGRFLETGALAWDEVEALARRRPVRLEASADLAAPLDRVRFDGWTFAAGEGPGDGPAATARATAHVAGLRARVPGWPAVELETRRVLMRNLASSADWLARQGHRAAAAVLLDAALALNPVDGTLRRMRAGVE